MTRWDREVDVLVIGSGAAGMTAALVCAEARLDVLVCDKAATLGGTTATSAGTVWIPGSPLWGRAAENDTPEQIFTYLDALGCPSPRRDLIEAFLKSGPEALEFLHAHSEVRFEPARNNPDYRADLPGGAAEGRALAPVAFDGRLLGADFARLRPPRPTLTIFGGMMIGRRELPDFLRPYRSPAAAMRVGAVLWRHLRDRLRYPRGTRLLLGNALVARFLFSLRARNVQMETGMAMSRLVREGERVTGAIMQSPTGEAAIRARRAVVLATGGFPGDTTRVLAHMPEGTERLYCYAYPESRGDALSAALDAGGVMDDQHAGAGFWTPVSVLRDRSGQETIWAHHSLDRGKPGFIAVDRSGQRFVNEADSYHDFVVAMLAQTPRPAVPAWLICDSRALRNYGLGMIRPLYQRPDYWVKQGYVLRAPTLDALASAAGIDAEGLRTSVAGNNRQAETGTDPEFGRGERPLNIVNGDTSHRPNANIGPIEAAPFYALPVYPGVLATSIGIRTDKDARVVNVQDDPIPGLYACGADMASIMRGVYPGPGISLGPAIAFAYRAARSIVSG